MSLYGEGKTQATIDINSWMIDKGGWVNDSSIDANGKPTQLLPTITQNSNGTETLSFGNIDYLVYIEYKTNLDPNSISSTTNKWDNIGIVN